MVLRFDESSSSRFFTAGSARKNRRVSCSSTSADYRHVPEGPGVMIVGNEGHEQWTPWAAELGIRYSRKRDQAGEPEPKLREAFARVLRAADGLEHEASLGPAKLRTHRVLVQVVSRLEVGNDDAAHAALAPALTAFASELYGAEPKVVRVGDCARLSGSSCALTAPRPRSPSSLRA